MMSPNVLQVTTSICHMPPMPQAYIVLGLEPIQWLSKWRLDEILGPKENEQTSLTSELTFPITPFSKCYMT